MYLKKSLDCISGSHLGVKTVSGLTSVNWRDATYFETSVECQSAQSPQFLSKFSSWICCLRGVAYSNTPLAEKA